MERILQDFVNCNSWFDRRYRKILSETRYVTMKTALNLFLQRGGNNIVETGCIRAADDWASGYSTVVFGEVCKRYNKHLWSVDIDIKAAQDLTVDLRDYITLVEMDSVSFLKSHEQYIDLLYLDSLDYPYGTILDDFGGKEDLEKALLILETKTEDEILKQYGSLIEPCQRHCNDELLAASRCFVDRTIVLIDDNKLAGGGKSRLAKQTLKNMGFGCVFDDYQTLWIHQ